MINNKYYIGKHQTKDLEDGYMGSGKLLKRAIQKHGIENFQKEILHVFGSEEEMNAKEKELVVISEDTYNLCEGGNGGFGYINRNGLRNSEKQRTKARLNASNLRLRSPQRRLTEKARKAYAANLRKGIKIRAALWRGQTHKPETITKMKQAQIGINNSQYGTIWITNGIQNKKIKPEEFDTWSKVGYDKGRK